MTYTKMRRSPSSKRSFTAQNGQVKNCACLNQAELIEFYAIGQRREYKACVVVDDDHIDDQCVYNRMSRVDCDEDTDREKH